MTSPALEPTPPSAGDGEQAVDGFSGLLVDRLGDDPRPEEEPLPRLVAPGWPALARRMGVWRGTFRRHDAAGCLLDSLARTVARRLAATGELRVREISQSLEGGCRRARGDQALQGECLVGRSHLEERQSSADWRAGGPAPMESDG